ncbi:MAG TPA: hypothetical protein VET23_05010 [Chitinophagaceae bacterium]|nr:hypothetical protein [Chitinophagaceae bacterium]
MIQCYHCGEPYNSSISADENIFVATGANSFTGGIFMLFFGLGTFPVTFTTVVMGNYLN